MQIVHFKWHLMKFHGYSDVGNNVLFVTQWWLQFQDVVDGIIMMFCRRQHLKSFNNNDENPWYKESMDPNLSISGQTKIQKSVSS